MCPLFLPRGNLNLNFLRVELPPPAPDCIDGRKQWGVEVEATCRTRTCPEALQDAVHTLTYLPVLRRVNLNKLENRSDSVTQHPVSDHSSARAPLWTRRVALTWLRLASASSLVPIFTLARPMRPFAQCRLGFGTPRGPSLRGGMSKPFPRGLWTVTSMIFPTPPSAD